MKRQSILVLILITIISGAGTNAVAQWYRIPDLKYTNVYCMLATGDSTIFIGGDNGTFLRSTNAGETWTTAMGSGFEMDTVLSLTQGCGYIFAGGTVSLFRSSDNGITWSRANDGLTASRENGLTTTENIVYAATDFGVFSSADSGKSWKIDTTGLNLGQLYPGGWGTAGITSVRSRLFTITAMNGGSVYTSTISDSTWTKITSDYYNAGFAIAAVDTDVFIGTMQGIFLYGGGTTWLSRNAGLPSDTATIYRCMFSTVGDSLLFAVFDTRNGPIYVTSDFGKSWTQVSDTTFGGASVTSIATSRRYLFAGTQSGAWRIPIADVITSVNETHPPQPGDFVLHRNYPNPFNPTTVISYQFPTASYVTLKIYDVLGREVAILVNDRETAGGHSVTFNAAKLPSGVYFYRLSTGNFTSTKKALLLK